MRTRTPLLLGSSSWLAAVIVLQPTWPIALLLLAVLVLVPGALELTAEEATPGKDLVDLLMLPAGLVLVLACALEPGLIAAIFALPWLVVTGLIALGGVDRLRRSATLADATIAFGLIYLAVGGVWTVLARLGARPLGFSDAIVGATAVHFHYAGFVLPIHTGLAARTLPGRSAWLACLLVIAGVPLVAAGITLSAFGPTWLEALAAWLLAAGCGLVAMRQISIARRTRMAAGLLLGVSALALLFGMGCAAVYAWGRLIGSELFDIPLMYRIHGAVNALGFALPGLAGWWLHERCARGDALPAATFEKVTT